MNFRTMKTNVDARVRSLSSATSAPVDSRRRKMAQWCGAQLGARMLHHARRTAASADAIEAAAGAVQDAVANLDGGTGVDNLRRAVERYADAVNAEVGVRQGLLALVSKIADASKRGDFDKRAIHIAELLEAVGTNSDEFAAHATRKRMARGELAFSSFPIPYSRGS